MLSILSSYVSLDPHVFVSATYSHSLRNLFFILGCLEPDTHYDNNDVDYSSDVDDVESCQMFCTGKSEYFTFGDSGTECYCKSSNSEPFYQMGTVSGETNCTKGMFIAVII